MSERKTCLWCGAIVIFREDGEYELITGMMMPSDCPHETIGGPLRPAD